MVNTIWNEVCQLAGVEGHTPHDARHSMGRHLIDKTGNIAAVQRQLGHTNPAYSMQYARITDLDLGKNLVIRFVIEFMPDDIYRIKNIFKRKGAYSIFKSLLEKEWLLKEWYDYENKWRVIALKYWCYDNKIDFVG